LQRVPSTQVQLETFMLETKLHYRAPDRRRALPQPPNSAVGDTQHFA
jgi:hypothetical protein